MKTNAKTKVQLDREQEHRDAVQLAIWRHSLKGIGRPLPDVVLDYLDEHLPNWRDEPSKK